MRKETKINLREIEISGLILKNVSATIVHEQNAPLLLGMSALNQLGKIEIEDGKLIINGFFKNENDIKNIEEETKNTINWINSKLIKHQYKTDDSRQIQSFDDVKEINGIYYLTGKRIQETTKPWGFSQVFLIPLLKINNVDFEEKQYNYWLTIKMKNAEEAIAITNDGENWNRKDKIDFIINKSIDDEDLKPLLLSAIEHLIKLYSNKQITINQKVVKYKVEGGYVEHIGEMLKDGWIKNSYDEQNRLESKQETYTDSNDKIKVLKTKTTMYNTITGKIKYIKNTHPIFEDEYIGEYKSYYDNGNLKIEGDYYDFFKNGFKVYFGGIRIGTWKWYLENGEADGEENYKVNIEYWENGTLKVIYGLYLDTTNTWIKHGAYYEFNKNESVPKVMKKYKYGELIEQK